MLHNNTIEYLSTKKGGRTMNVGLHDNLRENF